MLIMESMNLFKLCKNFYIIGVGCKINKINLQSRIKLQKKQSKSVKTRILAQIDKKTFPPTRKMSMGMQIFYTK